tara:strand:+ start:206 stop:823 length:618 start_codon:yes stop_codon:yes gene_type:complete
MSFFTDTSKAGGNSPFEPKRQFRWLISFSSIGNDATFMCKAAKKPAVSNEVIEHDFLNHKFKYPTKAKWEDIDVTFIDAFQANMGSRFYNILRGAGYKQPESFNESLVGFTKGQMLQAVGQVTLRQLDGGSVDSALPDTISADPTPQFLAGNVREEWLLTNAQITKITFGETLSYAETGLVEVSVGLAYDYASYTELTPGKPFLG